MTGLTGLLPLELGYLRNSTITLCFVIFVSFPIGSRNPQVSPAFLITSSYNSDQMSHLPSFILFNNILLGPLKV